MMAGTLNHIIRALKKLTLRYAYFFTYQESIFLGNPLKHIDLIVGGTSSAKKEMEKKAENAMRNFALRNRMEMKSEFSRGNHPARQPLKLPIVAIRISNCARGEPKKCIYSLASECKWTSPRAHPTGCPIRSGSPRSRKWA